jgi:amino acid transporter
MKHIFKKKNIDLSENKSELNKTLTTFDLTLMGIAAIIGAGIFSTIGMASFQGGPGVVFLFLIVAVTCGFSALCYAEFASRIPQSGSAYTYAYVSFGEIFGWIIGWALILEYAIGNIVVAISWSGYFLNLLKGIGIHFPYWLSVGYYAAIDNYAYAQDLIMQGEKISPQLYEYIVGFENAPSIFGYKIMLNIPAFFIVAIITFIAYIGIKETKKVSNLMVFIKIAVIGLVIGVGFFYINPQNYVPFLPNGFSGVLAGVSAVFFAYIGFDAISTTAEECKNPQRDLPRGMMYALIICTILYVLIALVLTGMVHFSFLKVEDPLAFVFQKVGLNWIGYIISISAVIATASVLLVFQIGQPRIWMSMSRDHLLPKRFSNIHPKYKTPAFSTLLTGILVGIPALIVPASIMTDLTSIGTLFAFVLVCLGVLALPKITKQNKQFKIPYVNSRWILPFVAIAYWYFMLPKFIMYCNRINHLLFEEFLFLLFSLVFNLIIFLAVYKKYNAIPILGAICCMYLMIEIPAVGWYGFLGWMALGIMIYAMYGYGNSKKYHQILNEVK